MRAPRPKARSPRVGFVSLGCPKALVDSERILTQLRAEGYAISPDYPGADLVVVNTCGFIDAAVEESLDAIGEALAENGRVIVTGCLGAKGSVVKDRHPAVLAVTGPHAVDEVMAAVHAHLPQPHDPFVDLVPPQGVKLTPKHYAYLKIAEGCNHRCTFCIIPSMRGDLVSRPIGEVMREAEHLVAAGVKELLVISQDTSAYGVDVRYRTGFWEGRPLKTRFTDLARALGEPRRLGPAPLRLSVPARRRGHPADGRRPGPAVSRRAVPALERAHPEADEAARLGRDRTSSASRPGARSARRSRSAAPSSSASRARRRPSSASCSSSSRRPSSTASAASPIRRSRAPRRTRCPRRSPRRSRRSGARASWRSRSASAPAGSNGA